MGTEVDPVARHPANAQSHSSDGQGQRHQLDKDTHPGRVVSPTRSKTRVEVDVEKIGELSGITPDDFIDTPQDQSHRQQQHRGGAGALTKRKAADASVKKQKHVPLVGYVLLILALLALSSLGAAMKLQGPGVTPTMKAYWRMVATALALLPLAGWSIRRDGVPRLSSAQARKFLLCAMGYATMTGSFAVSLSMSSMTETFILGNVGSLVIIAGKFVLRKPILLKEGLGAAIGFLGGVICADDTSSEDSHKSAESLEHYHPIKGGLIAFLASLGMAVYLTNAKELQPHMDLFVFMLCVMTLASFDLLAYMAISGEAMSLSNHHEHGLWGWTNLSRDRLPLEIHLVVVCNLIGTTGYVACMKYFDAVVVSTVMLMEPLTATLMGAAAGVDELPGVQTWVGGAVVTAGSLMVIFSNAHRMKVKPHAQ